MICCSRQRTTPNTPVILYRHTEFKASPSGNKDKEQGSLTDNDDSSETNDEMEPVSSKRYRFGTMLYCIYLITILGVVNALWSGKNGAYMIIYINPMSQRKFHVHG